MKFKSEASSWFYLSLGSMFLLCITFFLSVVYPEETPWANILEKDCKSRKAEAARGKY